MSELLGPRAGIDTVVPYRAQDSQDSQQAQTENGSQFFEPEPLRRPLPPAEPYPLYALGRVLGTAAHRICDVLHVPDAMAGQSILAAASLAVQAHADVEIDGRREPLSLWHLTIGESGERKSACDRLVLRAHREFERTSLEEYSRLQASHEIEMLAYETARKAAMKGNDPDVIHAGLVHLGVAPEPPLKPLLVIGNPTIEAIHKQLAVGLPSLGLFHDDAAEFLGGFSMGRDHRTKTAGGLCRLWDSGEFDRIRASDGGSKYYGKRFAHHLMMQPVIADTVLSDDMLIGQGYLARCLLAYPTSTIGSRPYAEVNLADDDSMNRYWKEMTSLLSTPPRMREGSRNELDPRVLVLTPRGKERWVTIHDLIEKDMTDGCAYASVRAWAAKASAQILRVAGVLTLVEQADSGLIDIDQIVQAATLVSYCLGEAVRIVGTNSVPRHVRDAERLLDWCHSNGITLLHSAHALRCGPYSVRDQHTFRKAISVLERTHWAEKVEGGCEVEGKLRHNVWKVRRGRI